MLVVFKWALRLVAVVAVCFVLGATVISTAFMSTLPPHNGVGRIAKLSGKVRVVRDANGVPQIEAPSYEDAARALGYVHAQDRFWQMHVLRMAGQGRLSEIFGRATINTDMFLRTVDIGGASEKSFQALSPKAQALLEAYAEGVNAWLTRETGLMQARLPPEFIILGTDSEPWESWHSLAILKLMAVTLDGNLDREIKRLVLISKGFSPHEIDELLPYGPKDNPPPLPDLRPVYGFATAASLPFEANSKSMPQLAENTQGLAWKTGITASNNWVVSGSRSITGKPLLANDPHLELTTPSLFYLAKLAFDDGAGGQSRRQLVGATLPGTPFVMVGRNERIAWGLTTTVLDCQDLFVERLKDDDTNYYLAPDGWQQFGRSEEEIKVSGGTPVKLTRRTTRHGPVLPDNYRGLSTIVPTGHVGALQWTALATDDTTAEGAMELNLARSVGEFMKATTKLVAPMQSIVVADTDGDIGIVAAGRVPVRDKANLVVGRAPVPGWLGIYDWKGWLGPEELPRIVNPQKGAIATANANWMPQDYSHHITYDWDENYRQARVEALVVDNDEIHSTQSMKAVQADDFSPALDEFRSVAMDQLVAGAGQDSSLLAAIRKWDGHMVMNSPLPLIMTAWWRHTEEELFRDDLGAEYHRFATGQMQPVIDAITIASARDWCDNRLTGQIETCGIILARALSSAIEELHQLQGPDWREWRWGRAHTAKGEHRPFSAVEMLSAIFSVTPESAGGSYTLLRGRTDFTEGRPYENIEASAFRGIYDLSDPDGSLFIISTGQSGHFLSRHYRDFADDWAEMRYVQILKHLSADASADVLNLVPAQQPSRRLN